MAELHWFPFFAAAWLSSPARMAMVPAQRGAYIDLLAYAWGNGEREPSLPADTQTLARLSGLERSWAKLGPFVLEQFTERDGRLYNAKLSEVWREQQEKYKKLANAGRKGGSVKGKKRKPRSSDDSASLNHRSSDDLANGKQLESETTVITLTELLPVVAPDVAPALEGPRDQAPGFALIRDAIHSAADPAREKLREAIKARRAVS